MTQAEGAQKAGLSFVKRNLSLYTGKALDTDQEEFDQHVHTFLVVVYHGNSGPKRKKRRAKGGRGRKRIG